MTQTLGEGAIFSFQYSENVIAVSRDVTRTLIGGGVIYSYIHVLPDEFSFFQIKFKSLNLKRNLSGKT